MKHFIIIQNKKYPYDLSPAGEKSTFVRCNAAKIAQEFPNEDVPSLLLDLSNLILAEKNYKKNETEIIHFRVDPENKKKIEEKAFRKGFRSVSRYMRYLALDPRN